MDWKPATVEDVVQFVKSDLLNCTPEQTAAFETHRVEPYLAPIERCGNLEYVVVVAKNGNQVIYWEDIEEGFGISAIDAGGQVLEQDCNQNSLGLALNSWINSRLP